MDALQELNTRLFNAVVGLKYKSPEFEQAVRYELNKAFADGLLIEMPKWKSPYETSISVKLRSEIKSIDISISIKKS